MGRPLLVALLCAGGVGCTFRMEGDHGLESITRDMPPDLVKEYRTSGQHSMAYEHGGFFPPIFVYITFVNRTDTGFVAVECVADVTMYLTLPLTYPVTYAPAVYPRAFLPCALGLAAQSEFDNDGKLLRVLRGSRLADGLILSAWEEKKWSGSDWKFGDGKSIGWGILGYDHRTDDAVWVNILWVPVPLFRAQATSQRPEPVEKTGQK